MNTELKERAARALEDAADAGSGYRDLTPAQTYFIADPLAGRAELYLEGGLSLQLEQGAWLEEQRERGALVEALKGLNPMLASQEITGHLLDLLSSNTIPPYIKQELLALQAIQNPAAPLANAVRKGLEPLRPQLGKDDVEF